MSRGMDSLINHSSQSQIIMSYKTFQRLMQMRLKLCIWLFTFYKRVRGQAGSLAHCSHFILNAFWKSLQHDVGLGEVASGLYQQKTLLLIPRPNVNSQNSRFDQQEPGHKASWLLGGGRLQYFLFCTFLKKKLTRSKWHARRKSLFIPHKQGPQGHGGSESDNILSEPILVKIKIKLPFWISESIFSRTMSCSFRSQDCHDSSALC